MEVVVETKKDLKLKNKEGKENFEIIEELAESFFCECSIVLFDAPKICLMCSKSFCRECTLEGKQCPKCKEEVEENLKLGMRLNKVKCKCITCGEELTLEQSRSHAQSEEEHEILCEGCSFKEKRLLVLLHQEQCLEYVKVENRKLREENRQLREENKKMEERMAEEKKRLEEEINKLKSGEGKITKIEQQSTDLKKALLAYKLSYGIGVPKDTDRATDLFTQTNHIFKLAIMAFFLKNYSKSIEIFNEIIKKDPKSTSELTSYCYTLIGICYLDGLGYTKNIKKAIEFFTRGVQLKNPQAIFELGLVYYKGLCNTKMDVKKGLEYLQKSAEMNCSEALYYLGEAYSISKGGVEKDFPKAFDYLTRAADLNNGDACELLYMLYAHHTHEGIERNEEKALHFLKKGADLKHSQSAHALAVNYQHGNEGCEEDIKKAIHYFQIAADANEPQSLFNLACFYEEGDESAGIKKDLKKAFSLFQKAADLGLQDAVDAVEEYKKKK